MAINSVPIPSVYQTLLINSSDTTPIPLCAGVDGQTVRLWGLLVTGGTTVTFKQDSTAVSGALAVTGLWMPLPSAGRQTKASASGLVTDVQIPPYIQSVSGGTINIVPGASGLAGIAYYTQD